MSVPGTSAPTVPTQGTSPAAPAGGATAGGWPLGFLYVMTVPYVAGISSIGDFRIAGFRYSGFIWAGMLACGGVLMLARKGRIHFPMLTWAPWFGFVVLSLAWVESYALVNFQDAFQIATPLVVGIVASMSIRTERELALLRRAFLHCVVIAWVGYAASVSGVFGDLAIAMRPMALTACFAGCVFAAASLKRPWWGLIGWAACAGIAFFTGSRTATVALLAIWAAHPLYRQLLAKMGAVAIVAVVGILVFYSPAFQERSFGPEGGALSDISTDQFDSAGRFETWPLIWEEASDHLVLGKGVGQARKFVERIWPGTDKAHNDYLRILFEQGLVGLFLFLAVAGGQLLLLRRLMRKARGEARQAFAAAYLGLVVLLLVAITDNPITYGVWYMHPLFAVLGGAYGVASTQSASAPVPDSAAGRARRT
ncbi:MAG: O-antigen ligase family protein [Planctomycetota bacterium]|jgi:O-antigen ligase